MRETGAYGGFVYLLDPGERVLRLALVSGLPIDIFMPWIRVGLEAPLPLTEAIIRRRAVWVGVGEMANRYPQVGMVLPYPFASAYAPITLGETADGSGEGEGGGEGGDGGDGDLGSDAGVLGLLWPGTHPAGHTPVEHEGLRDGAARLGRLLRGIAAAGRPLRGGERPRVLLRRPPTRLGHEEALAAAWLTERLPEGHCAVELDGRISYANAAAAELTGIPPEELPGCRLWEKLSWLSDPVFEDRFRRALLSRRPTSFTALRPPDRWLRFHHHPDAYGVSLRIAPAPATSTEWATPEDRSARAMPGGRAAPVRVGALYHLMQLAAVLTEAVGVNDVVDLVAGQIMPSLDAQGLLIFVAEGGRLRVVGHRGYRPESMERFDGTPMDSPSSPAARVLSEGEPAFYGSPDELEPSFSGLPALTGKEAWAVLPLIASGRTVGCCVVAYDRPHPFSPDERAVMTSLAGLIAQALERARLYDAKHHLARRLQAGLLPRALPEVPGLDVAARYLPATRGVEIGGDFYDLIRLGGDTTADTAVAAAIGDVQGHNVKAAALMGQVRTAVHATAGAPPGEVLGRANRLLTDLDPGLFTSCLYVDLDLTARRARLATAGHLPPLLRHPDGRVTALPVIPGPLLGIDRGAEYPAMEIPLLPGAVLVLYTDGLVEQHGRDLDECMAELAQHVGETEARGSMDELADALLRRARRSDAFNDDIALLLLSPR
ncbi:SpoIIE family protein phosphatase [Streptomyces sp. SBT349]|uniref:SpoIIE family protein phosphatase n=1 Tax=Streptomyces sp. SBT349 TaxID=1580539 RepID=UPI002D219FB1|nr:SpoIIE family protein phosphatase [Streptomyces sp. SBT349]